MRRAVWIRLLAISLVLSLGAVPTTAPTGSQPEDLTERFGVDLDAVRQAQKRAVERVGPVPAELSEAFAERPLFYVHPGSSDTSPPVLHVNERDLPEAREQMRAYLASRYRTMAAEAEAAGEPLTFKVPTLMFKVNNEDFAEDSTPERFEALLSGVGTSPTGTVTEMYQEQSHGEMLIDFDVYGPYTVSYSNTPATSCAYGTEGAPVTGDQLGLGGLGAKGMSAELVPQADPEVDFGEYDNDLDGVVDFLMIVHSGPDAAGTGDPCHVWSHYFPPIAGEGVPTTDVNADGVPVIVSPVMTIPEVGLEIGVTAHELMHALGEPDYYDTSGNTQGTGDWDLGAGGSWLGIPSQTNPIHFNPLMKVNFGWVEPQLITDTVRDLQLRPRATHPDLAMIPLSIAKAGSEEALLCDQGPVGVPSQNAAFLTEAGDCLVEGFLIEKLDRAAVAATDECAVLPADFDRQAYGSGLAVWHWDFRTYSRGGNNDPLRYMLDLEEFDRRDGEQELQVGTTRAETTDLFWGDPVGISSATQVPPRPLDVEPPAGSPWTVQGPPAAAAPGTEARTATLEVPTWTIADDVPDGASMSVRLFWENENDDWDLYVDRQAEDGTWEEVGSSAGGAPQVEERTTILRVEPGEIYQIRAYNWLGAVPTAQVEVAYTTAGRTQVGPAGTRDNDMNRTGWAITNIRPNDYRGYSHAAEAPGSPMTVDVIKHDDTTVDVSGDFLRVVQDSPRPVIGGEAVTLATNVYNHGGKATRATFSLFDRDPAVGGRALDTRTIDLVGFERQRIEFAYTPVTGLNELYVTASAPGDMVSGNDVVRTELTAGRHREAEVLIVDNDRHMTQEQDVIAVLQGLGVPFHLVEGEPTADILGRYDAAIWLTTTVSGAEGVLSPSGQEAIRAYLDGGGRVWLTSTRAMGYLGGPLEAADLLAGYFGLTADGNLLNSWGVAVGLGDGVGKDRGVELGYLDQRPYLDYGQLAAPADVAGRATALFSHSRRPEHVIASKVVGDDGFRSVYSFPLGLIQGAEDRAVLTSEVLRFLGVPIRTSAPREASVVMNRFRHVQPDQAWPVVVGATGPNGVKRVELHYRSYGGDAWTVQGLRPAGNGLFEGRIPAAEIDNNGLEYFVRALVPGQGWIETAGGAQLPDVASAPYGDPDPAVCRGR
jgi:M6 family metalloprotease-like protein